MNVNIDLAKKRLCKYIIKTPLVENEFLSEKTGKKIYLKLESMQRTGSFKFRGAMNYMLKLSEDDANRGIITASSGNHGLAMSLSGKLRNIDCTVIMPHNAPALKQDKAKKYGARVILEGSFYDESQDYAIKLSEEENLTYVPSFDDFDIIEGQGSILAEILNEQPDIDMVIVPVGGGGMLAGLLLAKEQLNANCQIVGVEPEGAAGMYNSLKANKLFKMDNMKTVADGVAVKIPGAKNFKIANKYKPEIILVNDKQIIKVQELLLKESKLITETAGAVSIAGMLKENFPQKIKKIACVVSGANLDLVELEKFI